MRPETKKRKPNGTITTAAIAMTYFFLLPQSPPLIENLKTVYIYIIYKFLSLYIYICKDKI